MSEAMLRAVAFEELDEERIAAWMTRVVVNLCADAGRDRARAAKRVRYAQMMDMDVPTPEEVAVERAAASSACTRLHALPATQRDALLLRASGLPVGEVASELGIGYKAAESLLSRGRAAVRAGLVAGVAGVLGGFRALRRSAAPASGIAVAAFAVAAWMPAPGPPAANDAGVASRPAPAEFTSAAAARPPRRAAISPAPALRVEPAETLSGHTGGPKYAAKREVVPPARAEAPGVVVTGRGVTAQKHERPWQDELADCVLAGELVAPGRLGCPPPEQDDETSKDAPLSP